MATRTIRLPRGTDLSQDVAQFIDELRAGADLPGGLVYWLRLAVDEITANIAAYGYGGGAGVIDLEAGVEPERVWIRIRDDSPPFDPRGFDCGGRLDADPLQREEGGYGLLLALAKLDGFDYLREAGRNCAVLIMSRAEPGLARDATTDQDQAGPR